MGRLCALETPCRWGGDSVGSATRGGGEASRGQTPVATVSGFEVGHEDRGIRGGLFGRTGCWLQHGEGVTSASED